jgi:hypothetical protein
MVEHALHVERGYWSLVIYAEKDIVSLLISM